MELHTDRLILRTIAQSDALALFPLINDLDVAAHMLNIPHPYPQDLLVSWIQAALESMEHHERMDMTIILKESGMPIGVCAINQICLDHQRGEVGYWLGKRYWGRGYMTEAVRRLLEYGFDDLDLYRIHGRCFMSNPASARVLEKAGMTLEGCARGEVLKNGKHLDVLHFGLIEPEFGL